MKNKTKHSNVLRNDLKINHIQFAIVILPLKRDCSDTPTIDYKLQLDFISVNLLKLYCLKNEGQVLVCEGGPPQKVHPFRFN